MPSIFSQEWRDCLRAHYSYVVRMDDHGTEKTLHGVMLEAGFGEGELKGLYVLATAHVDDVGVDFVPDAEMLDVPAAVAPEPMAEVVGDAVDEAEIPVEVAEELADDAAGEEPDESEVEPPPDEPDETQLSLF